MAAINWFEIPVTDLERAAAFYEALFDIELQRTEFMAVPHAIFPPDGAAGALVLDSSNAPSSTGAVVYFDAGAELAQRLDRVAALGGSPLSPVIDLGDQGSMALIVDTEGNRIGLHAA